MAYRKGDVVRIVPNRVFGMNYEGLMDEYLDTNMTIDYVYYSDAISGSSYRMKEDGGKWSWNNDMIACLASDFREYEINISQDDLMEMI